MQKTLRKSLVALTLTASLTSCMVVTDSSSSTSSKTSAPATNSNLRYMICLENRTGQPVTLYYSKTNSVDAKWTQSVASAGKTWYYYGERSAGPQVVYFRMDRDASSSEAWKTYRFSADTLSSSCATAKASYVIESRAGIRGIYSR